MHKIKPTDDFMTVQAKDVLNDVAKLGNETEAEQDEQDAGLRRIPFRVADRYLCRFGGSLSFWYGTDNHGRVKNRHGKVIATVD